MEKHRVDFTDVQSAVFAAERVAKGLMEKHSNDIDLVIKEVAEMSPPIKGEPIDFRKEVLWAASWIRYMRGK